MNIKFFSHLIDFGHLRGKGGGGGWINPLKKKNSWQFFFWDVKWSCKKFWKMLSADANAQVK